MKIIFIIISIALIVIIALLIKHSTTKNQSTITLDQARMIAEQKIQSSSHDHQMVITKTDVRDDGWVFYYTTQKYVETQDPMDVVPGNVPLVVHKDGTVEYLTPGTTMK